MIRLNLVVIKTENIELLIQWYSKTFNLKFITEKHGDGVLHYSAKLNEGLIEVYPAKQSSAKITFGFAIESVDFERIISTYKTKKIDENFFLIKDLDGNSIILSLLNCI